MGVSLQKKHTVSCTNNLHGQLAWTTLSENFSTDKRAQRILHLSWLGGKLSIGPAWLMCKAATLQYARNDPLQGLVWSMHKKLRIRPSAVIGVVDAQKLRTVDTFRRARATLCWRRHGRCAKDENICSFLQRARPLPPLRRELAQRTAWSICAENLHTEALMDLISDVPPARRVRHV